MNEYVALSDTYAQTGGIEVAYLVQLGAPRRDLGDTK